MQFGSILLCGGKGTRLQPLSKDKMPKSLFKVDGKELITYSLDGITKAGCANLVFAIDHHADFMRTWVEDAGFPQVVNFSEQSEPGVYGAIKAAAEHVPEPFFIACNTDEIREGLDVNAAVAYHVARPELATMVVTKSCQLSRHRSVKIQDGLVVESALKPAAFMDQPEVEGLVNTGFLILEKEALRYCDSRFGNDWGAIIEPLCEAGQLNAFVDERICYFNVGTPGEFAEASGYLESKIVNS